MEFYFISLKLSPCGHIIHEPVRIEGTRKKAIIMVDAKDFESLAETAYLLRSPANAKHLMKGLDELKAGKRYL